MTSTPLHVLAFDGGFNLPLWTGLELGLFEQAGLAVTLEFVPSSGYLVASLMEGKAQIGLGGLDNFIACQEGQSEVALPEAPDLFAFMGGDRGFLTLVARPGTRAADDLKGTRVSVDAMTTGFAFALREMLAAGGVADGEVELVKAGATATRYRELVAGSHAATLLRTPFDLLAAQAGFVRLARAEQALGAYMGTVGAARRQWADGHASVLRAFVGAYGQAMRWLCDDTNRARAAAILQTHTPGFDAALAAQAVDILLDARHGLIRDLGFDMPGVQTVLRLRQKYAPPARALDAARYLDTAYLPR